MAFLSGRTSLTTVQTGNIATGAVTTAKIAANNIDSTLTKDALIADYSEVTIAAGDSILLGDIGDGGNTKRDTVQGILDLAGGGAWNLIGTAEASASASLDVTGLDSTYDTYAIVGSDLHPATDNTDAWLRFGDSGGVDSGASDYEWSHIGTNTDGAGGVHDTAIDSYMPLNEDAGTEQIGNAAEEGFGFMLYLHVPADSTAEPYVGGNTTFMNINGHPHGMALFGARLSAITLDRVNLQMDTGNITSGRMSVYGIAHA